MRTVLVIAFPGDALAECVASLLHAELLQVTTILPDTVADHDWTVRDSELKCDGRIVCGILLRCLPRSNYSKHFAEEDQEFADTEIQALLLAASNLPSVFVVNRLGPAAFFDDSPWAVWRSLLLSSGVPVAPFVFGNVAPEVHSSVWLPHRSCSLRQAPDPLVQRVMGAGLTSSREKRSFLLAGDAIFPRDSIPHSVKAARRILQTSGIQLGELTVDSHQRIVAINLLPTAEQPAQAAKEIAKLFCGRLRSC